MDKRVFIPHAGPGCKLKLACNTELCKTSSGSHCTVQSGQLSWDSFEFPVRESLTKSRLAFYSYNGLVDKCSQKKNMVPHLGEASPRARELELTLLRQSGKYKL